MKDWPAHKWLGLALMVVGFSHIVTGIVLIAR